MSTGSEKESVVDDADHRNTKTEHTRTTVPTTTCWRQLDVLLLVSLPSFSIFDGIFEDIVKVMVPFTNTNPFTLLYTPNMLLFIAGFCNVDGDDDR